MPEMPVTKTPLIIKGIPAIVWGRDADKLFIFVHGKMSRKEDAEEFSKLADANGYQVLSFDLPEHGERIASLATCTPWDAVPDLVTILDYAKNRWSHLSLYATSLGVYFSLLAYRNQVFQNCLFVAPLFDMKTLIETLMAANNVSAEQLEQSQEIPIPDGEPLSWSYYQYAIEHPINKWESPTAILYPAEDNLTPFAVVERFASQFGATVTILEGSEHWIHTPAQLEFLATWSASNLSPK